VKTLPHSHEAERAVLAAAFLDDECLPEVRALLDPSQFYDLRNALIFRAICALADAGSAVDLVTVKDWLASEGKLETAGGHAYVSSILDGAVPSRNVDTHAKIVAEKARRRNILIRVAGIEEAAYNGTNARDLDELIESLAEERASEAAVEVLPALDLASEPGPAPEPLVGDETAQLIMPGESNVIASESGVGKTKLLSEIGLSVASGQDCMGWPVVQGPVVYVTSDGDPDMQRNLRRQWFGRGGDPARLSELPLHVHVDPDFCLEQGQCFDRLKLTLHQVAEKFGPPRLLIVESLSTNVLTTNLNDQTDVRTFFRRYIRSLMAAHPGMAVILSAHLKKKQAGGANDLATRVAGSMQIRGAVDCVIGLVGAPGNCFAVRRLKRSRSGGDFEAFRVGIVGPRNGPLSLVHQGPATAAGVTDEEREGCAAAVLEYMAANPGRQKLTAICAALKEWKPRGFQARAVQKACRKLADEEILLRTGNKPAAYELPAAAQEDIDTDVLEGLD